MRIGQTHNCCGAREITGVQVNAVFNGKIRIASDAWDRGDIALKTAISEHKWHGKPCASFSWIVNAQQSRASAALAAEFKKLGYTVRTVSLNKNPKTGHLLQMRIAIRG